MEKQLSEEQLGTSLNQKVQDRESALAAGKGWWPEENLGSMMLADRTEPSEGISVV